MLSILDFASQTHGCQHQSNVTIHTSKRTHSKVYVGGPKVRPGFDQRCILKCCKSAPMASLLGLAPELPHAAPTKLRPPTLERRCIPYHRTRPRPLALLGSRVRCSVFRSRPSTRRSLRRPSLALLPRSPELAARADRVAPTLRGPVGRYRDGSIRYRAGETLSLRQRLRATSQISEPAIDRKPRQ
jgi:hypothetical protein